MRHPEFDAYTKDFSELITYSANDIGAFHLYSWEWVDNLHFMLPPSRLIETRPDEPNWKRGFAAAFVRRPNGKARATYPSCGFLHLFFRSAQGCSPKVSLSGM